jgi:predicted ribosomally synthesized peptide with nif11-like leader
MSIADIERLATDLTINATLRAEAEKAFAASPATSVDDVIDFARAKGYSFTESELKEHAKAKAAGAGKQVTDAELDGVSGGFTDGFGLFVAWVGCGAMIALQPDLLPNTGKS